MKLDSLNLGLLLFFAIIHANDAVVIKHSPCKLCEEWYQKELKDTRWLKKLNEEFKCPCKVKVGLFSLTPIDNPSNKVWLRDSSCSVMYLPLCAVFHTGAYGCIRSKATTSDGARQQCCYDKSGRIIRPGSRGAGTPDRRSTFWKHQTDDVVPFNKCCISCIFSKKHCDYYINGVRKGDASHCPVKDEDTE